MLLEHPLLDGGTALEILADDFGNVRMASEEGAVAMMDGDGRIRSGRGCRKEFLEVGGFYAAADGAYELAVGARHLARDHGGPDSGNAAEHRLDQHAWRLRIGFEGPEIGAVGHIDRRRRPCRRRVYQPAFIVEQMHAADIGLRVHLRGEHAMHRLGRQLLLESIGGEDAVDVDVVDQVLLHDLEIGELLVEMPHQQLHGVVQLALGISQGALAEVFRHQRGADGDRRDQEDAAEHQPTDRAAAKDDRDAGRRDTVLVHVSAAARTLQWTAISQPPPIASLSQRRGVAVRKSG
ncbi:hypothetical protein ES703_43383 [subsurface metagenome]